MPHHVACVNCGGVHFRPVLCFNGGSGWEKLEEHCMRAESLEFLRRLVSTPSPSGHEAEIQKLCAKYAAPFSDDIFKDVHGNQYHVKNADAPLRIMLAGHVDEIALMINDIDDKGFLGFVAVGGVDPSVLDGQRVHVHGREETVPGVVGRTAIHLMEKDDRGKPLKIHELWIDIGARDKEDAESLVAIGDVATIDAEFLQLRNERAVARGFDNRIGAFVVLEVLRLLENLSSDCAVFSVTTVQEEIGLRGARTSSFRCDPHAAIAVDVGHAVDYPNVDQRRHREGRIAEGALLFRGPNINPVLGQQLIDVARDKEIPYQVAAAPKATGTDANAIQLNREGVATAIVSIPTRYMHSPVELISLEDAEQCARLIAEWIGTLTKDASFIP
jgi:endoglucanase